MSVVDLDSHSDYLESERKRHGRRAATHRDKLRRAAAFVEAAIADPSEGPEFTRALHLVAHSVKHLLSPRALAYLEGTLDDDARAGSIRWRELARLDLWLRRASLPVGSNAKKLPNARGFTATDEHTRQRARSHPHLLFGAATKITGRTTAAVYGIAKRAGVAPSTVVAALLNFGLERIAQALRESREVPPTLTHEQESAFPEAT